MDYVTWIIYAFPMFLLRLPIVTALLIATFKPEIDGHGAGRCRGCAPR